MYIVNKFKYIFISFAVNLLRFYFTKVWYFLTLFAWKFTAFNQVQILNKCFVFFSENYFWGFIFCLLICTKNWYFELVAVTVSKFHVRLQFVSGICNASSCFSKTATANLGHDSFHGFISGVLGSYSTDYLTDRSRLIWKIVNTWWQKLNGVPCEPTPSSNSIYAACFAALFCVYACHSSVWQKVSSVKFVRKLTM